VSEVTAHRASLLHCLGDPAAHADTNVEYFEDGLLVVADGHIHRVGPAEALLPELPSAATVIEHGDRLIVPGLIDCHVHFPQIDIIASYGERLLDWLDRYAYPAERRFADSMHAAEVAEFFTDELLRNGTTTALVFATVHPQSAEALFAAAARRNMRLVAGKVLMDYGCPEDLRDDAKSGYEDSKRLIEKWHGRGRLQYAVTPRFAITSSEEQLTQAGRLAREYPEVYIHTHLAENDQEVAAVAERFPESRSYLDVYERFGLLRERAVFAHCLHLDEADRRAMADKGAAIAFCPSSNLFLGSGLFDLETARRHAIRVGAGSDVGGGTSLSMLRTLSDAYKVLQLQEQPLSPFEAFYLATLGAAEALYLDDRIGNFETGKEADFIVLDPSATALTARRTAGSRSVADKLFALLTLGDDRAVEQTYLMGRRYRPAANTV
jgi:guanine deaminase